MLNTKSINQWLASMHIDLGNFDGTDIDVELTEMIHAQSKEFLSANPDENYEKAVMMEYINEYEYSRKSKIS